MVLTGWVLFDTNQAADANLAEMNTDQHGPLCLITRKIYFEGASPVDRPPDGILLSISGIAAWSSPVRLKLGVVGTATYACAMAAAPEQSPDSEGFYIAINVDGDFRVEAIQVDWLAYWN